MEQYKEVYCWKCLKCGRVLTTPGGAKRHRQKCRYTPPVIDGQMRFEDLKQDARRS